jgi:CO/xanthine dehydrogenase Mo-binding subunit
MYVHCFPFNFSENWVQLFDFQCFLVISNVGIVDLTTKTLGMGEPPFPSIFGALANALYKATGKRVYRQPFLGERAVMG